MAGSMQKVSGNYFPLSHEDASHFTSRDIYPLIVSQNVYSEPFHNVSKLRTARRGMAAVVYFRFQFTVNISQSITIMSIHRIGSDRALSR